MAPDALPSAIGASEVRTLTINPPIGPTAIVQSINGTSVDSVRFISSPRLGSILARIRNLPAGARPYLVTQPFDQTKRWVSLLQPQSGLAGDSFTGTAVFGRPGDAVADNFQKYWLTVVVSHRRFQASRVNRNGEAVAISNAEWESQYAPLLQSISEEPIVVKRIPSGEPAAITLNVDGAETGKGTLNGAPIPVDKYFDVFGELDLPGSLANGEGRFQAWVLVYKESDFDQYSADPGKSPVRQERAKISEAEWTLPWASLPAQGRYVVVAVLTENADSAPRYITDESVKAYSQPRLIECRPQMATSR